MVESPLVGFLKGSVNLVICKTCLDTFGLADRVRVGIVGGMTDIITALWRADTVIDF